MYLKRDEGKYCISSNERRDPQLTLRGLALFVSLNILLSHSRSFEVALFDRLHHHHRHHHVLYLMLAECSKTICSNSKTSEIIEEEQVRQ